jgi:hypothetical protein
MKGLMVAGAMLNLDKNGEFSGVGVSAFNRLKGRQNGLTIGIVNYARSLNGIQLGLINIVRDNPHHKVLPVANWNFGKSRR